MSLPRWIVLASIVVLGCGRTKAPPPPCPGPEVLYNGNDDDCDPETPDDDLDGDGLLFADDCDDRDPFQGHTEIGADEADNDCDGAADCEDEDLVDSTLTRDVGMGDPNDLCDRYCSLVVNGDIYLQHRYEGENPSSDLTRFGCVVDVTGDVFLDNLWNIPGTHGLHRLERVGKDLTIFSLYPEGFSLEFPSLVSVGGRLRVGETQGISTVDGLGSVRAVGDLIIEDTIGLVDLSGIYNLETVTDDVIIRGNASFTDADAQALIDEIDSIGGEVTIRNNGAGVR